MMGQIVQSCKDKTSHDAFAAGWHPKRMVEWTREQEFNAAYLARVKRLREERGWTSEQMATALGVPPERYRKYETRTPMPGYLIEPFALQVDRDVSYVLTGKAATPARQGMKRLIRTGTTG